MRFMKTVFRYGVKREYLTSDPIARLDFARTPRREVVIVPNEPMASVPRDLTPYQQILLEKQTLDIFESRHAAELVERLGNDAEFVVFGVVTEYCVRLASKGLLERRRRVSVVEDAIETLKTENGERAVAELKSLGARFIATDQALALLDDAR